jgi:hypothetical protein
MQYLTRWGYGVRGTIYIVMGLLTLGLIFGHGGAFGSPQKAIATIGQQPSGEILLWVVLIGMAAYAIWGVIRAAYDPLQKGDDMQGILTRLGFLISAGFYVLLALYTYGYISGAAQSGPASGQTQELLEPLMSTLWGRVVVGLIGLIALGVGAQQIYLGFKEDFDRQFSTYKLSRKEAKLTVEVGRFGTIARGVVFTIIGGLIIVAALRANPAQPVGVDAALQTLAAQPLGLWLLAAVAAGLIAFGVYSLLSAAWLRMRSTARAKSA